MDSASKWAASASRSRSVLSRTLIFEVPPKLHLIQTKRKLKDVIRGIIGDGFQGTQQEIAKKLKERGFRVTQSTISRTMNQMGIAKEIYGGQQTYKLRNEAQSSYRGSLGDLVVSINHNNSLIVIRTRPGSAMFVAGFLDHECKDILMGTIAGDDTIFAAPSSSSKLSAAANRVEAVLRSN